MEHWIERPAEPLKLYLAWQAPDHLGDRYRWAVGVLEPIADDISLRYLMSGEEFDTLNPGHSHNRLLGLGYQGYPGFKLRVAAYGAGEGVAEALMRRLPARNRGDFDAYKRQFRIAPQLTLS